MASKTCASCLWIIQRQQSRSLSKISKLAGRTFVTTSMRYNKAPDSNASTIPPAQPLATKPKIPLAGTFTTYTAYGMTEIMYKECCRQAEYSMPEVAKDDEVPRTEEGEDLGVGDTWWHTEVGLKPTFSTWSQVTMLHMYLLITRLRCFPKAEAQIWHQHLIDHFFADAENKMAVYHNLHTRGVRNKYLKDLFLQWRGLLAAYDEGLFKGDAVLASAIWRNVFKASEEVDIRRLAQIVSFMRRTLQTLDSLPEDQLAQLKFQSLNQEASIVRLKSPMMDLPFQKLPGTKPPGKK